MIRSRFRASRSLKVFDCTLTQAGPSTGCSQKLDLAQPEEKLFFLFGVSVQSFFSKL